MTYPILADFPIVHKKLLDLLGVRYLVQPAARPPEHMDQWRAVEEDAHPQAFDFIAGGVRPLPPYTVGENRTALPRTFVVFHTAPLPARPDILPRLLATDFRQEVLLESDPAPSVTVVEGMTRRADIRRYEPNRVVVDVPEGPAGWLVLADLWYPGWTCRVDDMPVTVERANYLFRAVAVPEGRHEIVFVRAVFLPAGAEDQPVSPRRVERLRHSGGASVNGKPGASATGVVLGR